MQAALTDKSTNFLNPTKVYFSCRQKPVTVQFGPPSLLRQGKDEEITVALKFYRPELKGGCEMERNTWILKAHYLSTTVRWISILVFVSQKLNLRL